MKRKNLIRKKESDAKAFDSLSMNDKQGRKRPNVPTIAGTKSKTNYDEKSVIAFLEKRGCKRVGADGLDISKASGLGNSSWGRLSFLENYCGMFIIGRSQYRDSLKRKED